MPKPIRAKCTRSISWCSLMAVSTNTCRANTFINGTCKYTIHSWKMGAGKKWKWLRRIAGSACVLWCGFAKRYCFCARLQCGAHELGDCNATYKYAHLRFHTDFICDARERIRFFLFSSVATQPRRCSYTAQAHAVILRSAFADSVQKSMRSLHALHIVCTL